MLVTLIVIVCIVVVVAPLVYFVWMHTARLDAKDADALIILGYRCDEGEVHPLLQERLDTAVRLFRKHRYTAIIVSGGAVHWNRSEAEIMRDGLLRQGIPPEAILLEDRSRNTVHNVVNCRVLMNQHGYESCVLVSNSFHIRRMKYIMKRLGMKAGFSACRDLGMIMRYQIKLTFQEVQAFKLTLPWLERAQMAAPQEMMGK